MTDTRARDLSNLGDEADRLDGVTATTNELNLLSGSTSATGGITVAANDQMILNDDGTMVQVTISDLANYFGTASGYTNSSVDTHLNVSTASSGEALKWNGSDYEWGSVSVDLSSYVTTSTANSTYSPIAGSSSIVTTGALAAGTIATGFGTISTQNTITTTAAITGGTIVIPSGGSNATLSTETLAGNITYKLPNTAMNAPTISTTRGWSNRELIVSTTLTSDDNNITASIPNSVHSKYKVFDIDVSNICVDTAGSYLQMQFYYGIINTSSSTTYGPMNTGYYLTQGIFGSSSADEIEQEFQYSDTATNQTYGHSNRDSWIISGGRYRSDLDLPTSFDTTSGQVSGFNASYRLFHAGSNLPKQLSMNWVNSYDSASAFFTGSYRYFNGWNTYSSATYNYVKGINIVVNQDNIKAGGVLKIYGVEI